MTLEERDAAGDAASAIEGVACFVQAVRYALGADMDLGRVRTALAGLEGIMDQISADLRKLGNPDRR